MKPSDLKSPFVWSQRHVVISDRIFYVPPLCENYEEFHFPGWSDPQFFGNDHPIRIEYCSGNGTWIAEKAALNPEVNWVAVERKFERVRKIWSKIKNYHLSNLIVVCGEAKFATRRYFPSESFSEAYINFPDPWPKNRHAKNRLICPDFVGEMRRVLTHEATFTLVTDDPDYSCQMIQAMRCEEGFSSVYPSPFFVHDLPDYGSSYFENLWRGKGKEIYFHRFRKTGEIQC